MKDYTKFIIMNSAGQPILGISNDGKPVTQSLDDEDFIHFTQNIDLNFHKLLSCTLMVDNIGDYDIVTIKQRESYYMPPEAEAFEDIWYVPDMRGWRDDLVYRVPTGFDWAPYHKAGNSTLTISNDFESLKPGLYRVHYHDHLDMMSTLAAVGATPSGERWIAPCDVVCYTPAIIIDWGCVKCVDLIEEQ